MELFDTVVTAVFTVLEHIGTCAANKSVGTFAAVKSRTSIRCSHVVVIGATRSFSDVVVESDVKRNTNAAETDGRNTGSSKSLCKRIGRIAKVDGIQLLCSLFSCRRNIDLLYLYAIISGSGFSNFERGLNFALIANDELILFLSCCPIVLSFVRVDVGVGVVFVIARECFLAESSNITKEIGETLEIKNKIVKQISHKEKTPFLSLAVWGSRLHKKLINGLSLSQ